MNREKYIELRQVTKTYGNITAVDDFSLNVYEGDIYGFLGPNGAGKSTCIRMMLSLVRPSSGYINMFGYDIRTHKNKVLRNIGALIERPDFYDYLPARKNLEILSRISKIKNPDKKISELLELVGLSERADSKVKTYSQGMKQRLGIAQSLLHDPKLIILDEPANGLDPQGQKEIRELIKTINRDKGITVLLSSHILSEIEEIANRMVIINKGRSEVEGDVNELLNQGDMVVTFEVREVEKALSLIRQTSWANKLENNQKTGEIILKIERNEIPQITHYLSHNEVDVYGIKPVRSLENYFLKITQHG
ncbi:MAG: ATP-binding cassette domain-containing protein [Bacteroidales bacterium]|nr:ATP-binding cassette domain-containing protein [Bacteroidales bacterium]MCF8338587.1 ATP-binding cassette domain-containing protein [Bacteroidales bacterium]